MPEQATTVAAAAAVSSAKGVWGEGVLVLG